MEQINAYSIPGFREPFSCFSHLLAAPVFAVWGYFLVKRGRGDWVRTASLTSLAVSTVYLLSMSGVYHLLGPGTARYVMLQLDMAGIFLVIAGTATPIHAILFRGFNRWAPLILIWSAAVAGITLRIVFRESLGFLGTPIFLLLGWGGLVSCILLWKRYGFLFIEPFLAGGVAYTVGAIVLELTGTVLIPGVIGPHELWHVAVLAGLWLHWKFVFQFAGGPPEAQSV